MFSESVIFFGGGGLKHKGKCVWNHYIWRG